MNWFVNNTGDNCYIRGILRKNKLDDKKKKKKFKILIMGLPGSGKTYLAQRIVKLLNADWFNADKIRGAHNDWDFSNVGIIRQVKRMKKLADNSKKSL